MERQKEIKEWFNATYKSRGLNYLRPLEAYHLFIHLLDLKEGEKLLDVACGPGLLLQLAHKKKANVHGIDISDEGIRIAQKKLPGATLAVGNAEEMPFEDNCFEALTCIASMERFLNLDKALLEFHRVGRENCNYIFMVRNSSRLSWKLIKSTFGIINKKGNQNAKSLNEWRKIFTQSGFKIERELADPWPLLRWKKWLFGFRNPENFVKMLDSTKDLQNAYELIFVLKKN